MDETGRYEVYKVAREFPYMQVSKSHRICTTFDRSLHPHLRCQENSA